MNFPKFFSTACGDESTPYDYQSRLAKSACECRLITVPTGVGKRAILSSPAL